MKRIAPDQVQQTQSEAKTVDEGRANGSRGHTNRL